MMKSAGEYVDWSADWDDLFGSRNINDDLMVHAKYRILLKKDGVWSSVMFSLEINNQISPAVPH